MFIKLRVIIDDSRCTDNRRHHTSGSSQEHVDEAIPVRGMAHQASVAALLAVHLAIRKGPTRVHSTTLANQAYEAATPISLSRPPKGGDESQPPELEFNP